MSRLEALAIEEDDRRVAVEAQCDRLAAALSEFRSGVHYDQAVTTVAVNRRMGALVEAEQLWNAAKLARLNAEAAYRNASRYAV